ncbi:hypothetical protein HXX76_012367 [Chlamydomonas incerta]|uniref:Ankyrin repeat domain-containing protein n=1 Tax=Chlamydomonas incerta TaxID=51695 RepID=A0A835SX11_CHLIN|nr:hypothetical protein HXX76_012367 [Chlamydomonas incerta]|eukprot:KAG2427431.1 hypothetical protein HXX76_012367 [Chlamydomonas incerta]
MLGANLIRSIASFLPAAEVAISLKLLDKEAAAALRDFRGMAIARPPPGWMLKAVGGMDYLSRARPAASKWFCLAKPGLSLRLVTELEWSRPAFWRRLNLRQRRQLLCAAASSGDRDALCAALQHGGCSLTSPVLAAAAAAGNCDICRFLAFQQGCPWEACISWAAAGHGQLETFLWAVDMEKRAMDAVTMAATVTAQMAAAWVAMAARLAAAGGVGGVTQPARLKAGLQQPRRPVVIWYWRARLPQLAARGVSIRAREDARAAVRAAAGAGWPEVLRHLLDMVCPQLQLAAADVVTDDVVDSAVQGGHLPVLRLLWERASATLTQRQVRRIAQAGHVEVVRWLAMTPSAVAPAAAAAGGGASAAAGGGAAGGSSSHAAAAGDDTLWPLIFSRVAEAGCDLALLQLLHEEHGASIDLMAVARGGSLEQLSWAVATLRAAGRQPQVSRGPEAS